MKKNILIILLIFCCINHTYAQRTYVLITGVSNYQDSELNLTQSTKDAKSFAKIMKTQTPNVILLTSRYANYDNIMEKLRAICNRATSKDKIIFFYSGHGGKSGILVYDKYITYYELMNTLQSSNAQHKICFIDACHAGSIFDAIESKFSSQTQEKDIVHAHINSDIILYAASRDGEYSYENGWIGAGYFTQALLKGIQGKADDNHDRNITVIELFKYIYNDVMRRSKSEQHPQLITSPDNFDVVITTWD